MKKISDFFNKFERKDTKFAFMWAIIIFIWVIVFFWKYDYCDPIVVFVVSTMALDLTIFLIIFYRQAHIILSLHFLLTFVMFYLLDFDTYWIVDFSHYVFRNMYNLDYPFSISAYVIYIVSTVFIFLLNICIGPGTGAMYQYFILNYYFSSLVSLISFLYLMLMAVSVYFAAAVILFLPLLVSLAVGLFGNKLGCYYSGILTTGAAGFSAFAALFLWILHPLIFNNTFQHLVEFFKIRRELYADQILDIYHKYTLLKNDPYFAKDWNMVNHPDTIVNASDSYIKNWEFADMMCKFLESYTPFKSLKNSQDLGLTTDFGEIFSFYSAQANWLFKFDNLALTMAFTILFISFLVHMYSCDYMKNDAHAVRFFSYLSLFTFFMVMLVLSANMIVFYIAWEGVGLCSFLLISFWFTRAQAVKAGLKALLVNKIGDVFLIIAAALAFNMCGSFDFSIIFSIAPVAGQAPFLACLGLSNLDVLCVLLLLAASVKSAQLFFHIWLADAMEGPTPVSALLHAATMVTAGVFLIIRFSYIFEYSPIALSMIVYIGLTTTVVSGLIGLFQYDIKKIIAYSTCSQLGLMFIACGLSGYTLALFHFFNHAFFKALLFLSAGMMIHALKNEQDIRKMGGLKNLFPFTYTVFIIASLSLVGFPFFSGYFSKDAIIALAYAKYAFTGSNYVLYCLILFSVFLTCFYSFKLVFYVFFGNGTNISKHLHLSMTTEQLNFFNTFPLLVLSILSITSGAFFKDYFIGCGSNFYYSASIFTRAEELKYFMFFKEQKIITLFIIIISYLFCTIFAKYYGDLKVKKIKFHLYKISRSVFVFFNRKAFFDELYNFFIVSKLFRIGDDIFQKIDKGLLEYFGPHGVYLVIKKISSKIREIFNAGPIPILVKFMLLGIITILVLSFSFGLI